MEFKSTLEREREEMAARHKQAIDSGMKIPPMVLDVNNLIKNSPHFQYTFNEAIKTVKTIQPSITEEDCRIAVCLELTLCSTLIYNLIEDGLLIIKEV